MPKNMKYIVIGRTASGKNLFLKQLRELGFKIMENYATGQCILDADILLLDPQGVYDVTKEFPDIMFRILYINGTDEEKRKLAYIRRFDAEHKSEAEQEFESRDNDEDACFIEFERKFWNKKLDIPNIIIGRIIGNNYENDSAIFSAAKNVLKEIRQYERTDIILRSVVNSDLLNECDFIFKNTEKENNFLISVKPEKPEYDEYGNEITSKLQDISYNKLLETMCVEPDLCGIITSLFLSQPSCPDLNDITTKGK